LGPLWLAHLPAPFHRGLCGRATVSERRNHAVNESDRGPCRSRVGFPRTSKRPFSTRPPPLLITRVFPPAGLLNNSIILFVRSCLMKKIALLFALVLFAGAAYAQDEPTAQDKKDSPAAVSPTQSDSDTRIQALEMQVRSLADEVAALHAELRELRKASLSAPTVSGGALPPSSPVEPGAPPVADGTASSHGAAPAPQTTQTQTFGGATSNAKLLNPDISLIGDFIGAAGRNRVAHSRSIELHESEIGLQA